MKFSIMPQGLREKLMVAFSLMSILPLLVLSYVLWSEVFPHTKSPGQISVIAGLAIVLAVLGFLVARGLVFPVIRMSSEAKAIVEGNLDTEVDADEPGELGNLGMALNQMTQRVRDNMRQLQVYGEQTKFLNLEINRHILAFSDLLHASNLITQSASLEEIRGFILEKLSHLEEAELNCLMVPVEGEEGVFLVDAAAGVDRTQVELLLHKKVMAPWLARALHERRLLVIDDSTGSSVEKDFLESLFGMRNAACQPLVSVGKAVSLLISANQKQGFTFEEDAMNLLRVFARQMGIAIENDTLTKRAALLEITDELTGLYNAKHMRNRLEEEIQRAIRFHHSCSLAVFRLGSLDRIRDVDGSSAADEVLKQVAGLFKKNLTEVDRVGRTGPEEFTLILPERNKREAIELAEAIRQQIERQPFTSGSSLLSCPLSVSAGVSENPLDGSTAAHLLAKATEAIQSAKR
ncbi:MAG: diguanylate cyclase [Candidatus Omnitrophica bacterium]|nr:diguanylate cyclase [Candidatus Omnitrophota bacterium]